MEKYKAFTLLELIVVMAIIFIIMTMGVISYRSLVDSFSINEVSLTIAQDIRATQRSAMMLERDSDERWLHGIGLDFSRIEEHREYTVFKWCSAFDYFDESQVRLKAEVPNFDADLDNFSQLSLPVSPPLSDCSKANPNDGLLVFETKRFGDYSNLDFELVGDVGYILFESVSGKAFFYDKNSPYRLLNYSRGGDGIINLRDLNVLEVFELKIEPMRKAGLNARTLFVRPVSGVSYFDFD